MFDEYAIQQHKHPLTCNHYGAGDVCETCGQVMEVTNMRCDKWLVVKNAKGLPIKGNRCPAQGTREFRYNGVVVGRYCPQHAKPLLAR